MSGCALQGEGRPVAGLGDYIPAEEQAEVRSITHLGGGRVRIVLEGTLADKTDLERVKKLLRMTMMFFLPIKPIPRWPYQEINAETDTAKPKACCRG